MFPMLNSLVAVLLNLPLLTRGENVLMVIGGQYFNASSRLHDMVHQVEVLGPRGSCQVASLPSPVYGLTAARLGDTVLACGGFHHFYRRECYEFSPNTRQWKLSRLRLEVSTGFPASVSYREGVIMAGGRDYERREAGDHWQFYSAVNLLTHSRNSRGNLNLGQLPQPLADFCLVITSLAGNTRLWAIGGSNVPQRYRMSVHARDLDNPSSQWVKMPDLLDARMWQGCVVTQISDQKGILVTGGYYNGVSSMFLPLEDVRGRSLETFGLDRNMPRWEYISGLTKERKWGPAVGYIGDSVAVAGGGDYGDETVDILQGANWRRSGVSMIYKREFCAGVTVPSHWFPDCDF